MIHHRKPWVEALREHKRHGTSKSHINSMHFQFENDYFNDIAIDSQLEVSFLMFKNNIPERLYCVILFVCHKVRGLVGNTGHSKHRLGYYMNSAYKNLKNNAMKQLRKPRPWSKGMI